MSTPSYGMSIEEQAKLLTDCCHDEDTNICAFEYLGLSQCPVATSCEKASVFDWGCYLKTRHSSDPAPQEPDAMLEHGHAIDELTKRVEALEAKLAELGEEASPQSDKSDDTKWFNGIDVESFIKDQCAILAELCRNERYCPKWRYPYNVITGVDCPSCDDCKLQTADNWRGILTRYFKRHGCVL